MPPRASMVGASAGTCRARRRTRRPCRARSAAVQRGPAQEHPAVLDARRPPPAGRRSRPGRCRAAMTTVAGAVERPGRAIAHAGYQRDAAARATAGRTTTEDRAREQGPDASRRQAMLAEDQRLALVPPKPKLFDSAARILRSLACCGTRSMPAAVRRIVEVERRRHHAVADRQDREDRLDRAGRAEQMADRRLGRGHRQLLDRVAEQPLHRAQLDLVAERRRGAVGVDVVDVRRASGSARFSAACMARKPPLPSSGGAVMW